MKQWLLSPIRFLIRKGLSTRGKIYSQIQVLSSRKSIKDRETVTHLFKRVARFDSTSTVLSKAMDCTTSSATAEEEGILQSEEETRRACRRNGLGFKEFRKQCIPVCTIDNCVRRTKWIPPENNVTRTWLQNDKVDHVKTFRKLKTRCALPNHGNKALRSNLYSSSPWTYKVYVSVTQKFPIIRCNDLV